MARFRPNNDDDNVIIISVADGTLGPQGGLVRTWGEWWRWDGGLLAVLPTKNRAAGARFWLTKHGGCLIWAEGTWLVRGTLELMGWEVGNERRTRVGENLA